jgi:hypothetical protein
MFTLVSFNTFAQAQLNVSGNGNEISRFSASFRSDNFTNYGAVFNTADDVDANQLSKTFTIENDGDADLEITNIHLVDAHSFFDITSTTSATLAQGETLDLTIHFNAHKFGVGFARVVIESNDAGGEFFFYIKAKNIFCDNSFECFGRPSEDPSVCSGNGTCTAANTCDCDPLITGTNCQIPIRWSTGDIVASASFDFTPRVFIGPRLSDPNAVYEIKVSINALDNFPGSLGISIGLLNVPAPDMVHNIGTFAGEYGYVSSTGETFARGSIREYGASFDQGDIVHVIYDAPNENLIFALQKQGSANVMSQGVAFTSTEVFSGKKLHFGMSVTCFGACEFEFVD